jgi:hypothetical protein
MLFIILIFFLVLAFRDFSLLRTHFRLFTDVLRKFLRSLMREMAPHVKIVDPLKC